MLCVRVIGCGIETRIMVHLSGRHEQFRGICLMNRTITGWLDRLLAKPIRHLFETPERMLRNYVAEGMTVLDVGCGGGYYSLGMARLVGREGRVVAVDTSAEAVAELRTKAAEAHVADRIEPRISEDRELGIGEFDDRVDFALAVYVLHHCRDAAALFHGVDRALKMDGKFLVVEPRHHASAPEREAIETAASAAGFIVDDHPRLRRDWAALFVKVRTKE
jgi:SAM-dependent methyltransferase